MQVRNAAAAVGAALLLGGGTAGAGGFETVENGTVADGRAGAFVARASDPTALMLNVAGIGTGAPEGHPLQVYIGANVSMDNNCFQRAGVYDGLHGSPQIDLGGPSSGNPQTVFARPYAGAGYPQVCNNAPPFVAPNILATYAVNRRFGIGLGLYGPNSVGQTSYPDTVNATLPNGTSVLAPDPARYILMSENLIIVHAAIGASYEVIPGVLRLGATIEPSLANLSFTTMANANASQSPGSDLQTSVTATGFFFAGSLGALFTPTRFLQFGVNAHLTTPVSASGSGNADMYHYAQNPALHLNTPHFGVDDMSVAMPQQVRVGGRVVIPRGGAQRLNDPEPQRAYNPMRDEVADIEVDGTWEGSSAFDSLNIGFSHGPGNSVCVAPGTGGAACGLAAPLPSVNIPHQWNNVWGVRVGGDWNILPDQLAVRAGVAFETGSETPQYMNLDLPGTQTFSVHAGATWRIAHRWSINLAYAHQFISTVDNTGILAAPGQTVTDANAGIRTIGTTGAVTNAQCSDSNMAGTGACTNNRGVFTASLDVVSLGVNLAF